MVGLYGRYRCLQSAADWLRQGDDDSDGIGQRWMGLSGRRTTTGGSVSGGGRGGAGESLIAREIREQRERELQLTIQRRHAISAENNDVTSPCRDDVSVTSSSPGDPETETQRDSNVTVHVQPPLSQIARQSKLAAQREEELQKVSCQCHVSFGGVYK